MDEEELRKRNKPKLELEPIRLPADSVYLSNIRIRDKNSY
jgi:hypothetical protein